MGLEEATLPDGPHDLYVYRCDEQTKLHPADYLGLAANLTESSSWTNSPEPGSVFTCSHKEIMTIQTMLCSTKLTQNGYYRMSYNGLNNLSLTFFRGCICYRLSTET